MSSNLSLFGFRFHALGGGNELQIYSESRESAEAAATKAIQLVQTIEARYSRYKPDSIVSRINDAAGASSVEVDSDTAALIDFAATLYSESKGLFDITSGILRSVWNFREKKLPSDSDIASVLPLIGFDKVEWRRPFIKLLKKGMEIDFGGIGKEYAVDRVASLLKDLGASSALVNLGGDLRVTGPHPNGAPWVIGVTHPRRAGEVLMGVELSSGSLATSGDYERFFEIDGVRYCHILNPKTGRPVTSFQSVSILSESCLIAGSASTVAMLLGEGRGKSYLSNLGLPRILVSHEGKVEATPPRIASPISRNTYSQRINDEKAGT